MTDRRILWWSAFCGILATLGFLIASLALWNLSKFPIQTSKMVLAAACFGGIVLACFAIDYLWTARKYYSNYALRGMDHRLLDALLILLIIAVILLFLNLIFNIFNKRASHFLFGILLVLWVFIFVCILGLILRDMRKR